MLDVIQKMNVEKQDLLTRTADYLPSVEFYDPKRVPQDFYSQDKEKTKEILLTKLGFDRRFSC
jgi:hypothetical protein